MVAFLSRPQWVKIHTGGTQLCEVYVAWEVVVYKPVSIYSKTLLLSTEAVANLQAMDLKWNSWNENIFG